MTKKQLAEIAPLLKCEHQILISFNNPHRIGVKGFIYFDSITCEHAAAVTARAINEDDKIFEFFKTVVRLAELDRQKN